MKKIKIEFIILWLPDGTVRRSDCGKMADEEVLFRADILRMCGNEWLISGRGQDRHGTGESASRITY